MSTDTPSDSVVLGIHHSGISVGDLDAALAFWEPFLGTKARFRGRLDRPYLARSVGYPGVAIEAALIDLPDGRMVELLDYQVEGRERQPDDSFHPGHTHTCLDGIRLRRGVATGRRRRRDPSESGRARRGRRRPEQGRARVLPAPA